MRVTVIPHAVNVLVPPSEPSEIASDEQEYDAVRPKEKKSA